MEKTITRVSMGLPTKPKLTKVVAYARVSTGKDAMLHSLSAQISYYSDYIQKHPGWQYCGVYSDEAITGTKEKREGFQQLLSDCRSGKIDLVLTKSISRFARNTVTLLQAVRELKSLGVDVFFEEQNIHTMSAEGELMLTILASYAQEESLSVSENMKWRIRRNFEEGILWSAKMLGYDQVDGSYIINPAEAEIVRQIYSDYLSGMGVTAIMKKLNDSGTPTGVGGRWYVSGVMRVLRNYSYTGNLLQQHKYRENHITKRTLVNNGELPRYHALNTHEAIIDSETFAAVQTEIQRKADKYYHGTSKAVYPFSGLLICDNCGKHYRRKTTATGPVWICTTYNTYGKKACASKAIPEGKLAEVVAEVLDTEILDIPTVQGRIKSINVQDDNELLFIMADGTELTRKWVDRSRSESWTAEMKAAAGQKTAERWRKNNG